MQVHVIGSVLFAFMFYKRNGKHLHVPSSWLIKPVLKLYIVNRQAPLLSSVHHYMYDGCRVCYFCYHTITTSQMQGPPTLFANYNHIQCMYLKSRNFHIIKLFLMMKLFHGTTPPTKIVLQGNFLAIHVDFTTKKIANRTIHLVTNHRDLYLRGGDNKPERQTARSRLTLERTLLHLRIPYVLILSCRKYFAVLIIDSRKYFMIFNFIV